jgi:F0F1-type ATP synthase membrane subunit c/vacuolar-type H+-ATPase subunit K
LPVAFLFGVQLSISNLAPAIFPRQIGREENKCFSGQAIFAKQMTKKAEQESGRHVIKATKEINMQYLILLAVVSSMVLYVLIIAGCLCYVGRHGRRTF